MEIFFWFRYYSGKKTYPVNEKHFFSRYRERNFNFN